MKSLNFRTTEEAKKFIEQNKDIGIVLFMDQDKTLELSEFSRDEVILCSSAGEYSNSGFREHAIVGFSYDTNFAEVIEIKTPAIRSLKSLQSGYEKVKSNPNAFLLLLSNGLSMGEESILSTLFFIDDDFKIIGGSAGDYCNFKGTNIYIGEKKVDSVGIYFNIKKKTRIIKENIYYSTGKKLLITKADTIQRTVYEINGNKASVEYAKALGISENELSNKFIDHPLGRVVKDTTFISSPMKINPDKSITFYSQILPDTFVEVLQPSNIMESFKSTINQIGFKPGFILSIHCILRCLKFKKNNTWTELDKALLPVTSNQVGFISYGEQFYKRHLNQTMVILVVEE